MSKAPWIKFYPKDWLDFRVTRMTLHAQGAYIRILGLMWSDSPDMCSIEDNPDWISRALGIPKDQWTKIRKQLMPSNDPIFQSSNGKLVSLRLKKESDEYFDYIEKQSKKGKASAQQRFNRGSTAEQPRARVSESESEAPKSSFSSSDLKRDSKESSVEKDIVVPNGRPHDFPTQILVYLNEQCGTNFTTRSKQSMTLIQTRMREGYSEDDFKTVIDNMVKEWLHDPKMQAYLRPITLFGTKFESYLQRSNLPQTFGTSKTSSNLAAGKTVIEKIRKGEI
jgi:uncharacterized phage protein (TIGR02220 family)